MQVKNFTLFHLNLVPVNQPSFDTLRDLTREQWLRQVLGEPFEFPYHGGDFLHWVPQDDEDNIIVGIIEKTRERLQHLPPSEGGSEIVKEEWQGAYVIIDPTHHIDGQKMAVENDIVGKPQALVKYLARDINNRDDRPYEFEPRLIFDSNDFSLFLETNGPSMRWVQFHFVVPNMWNTAGRLDEELKETGEETGTEELDLTFKSRRGLRGDADRIREGVDYAARGAGVVRAEAVNGKKYNSRTSPTTSRIEVEDEDVIDPNDKVWLRKFKDKILSRE